MKSIEEVTKLVKTNFTDKDMWATLTYSDEKNLASEKQAEVNTNEFIQRLEKWLEENEVETTMKYVCVTKSNKEKLHHHIIINFSNKEALEKLWDGGGRIQVRRLMPDEYGHEGLVRYMLNGHVENSLITNISE